jgi:mRNA-degrading endonuclease RelE of RelBE toxin-antitoxin system
MTWITGTLPADQRRLSKPLRYELTGWHVARCGDYRVTFRILDDDHVLLIGRIEHRAHAYRRR